MLRVILAGLMSIDLGAGMNNQLSGFGYDPAGNMTSNSSINASYVYDAENRLIWTNSSSGYRYLYDGNGERIEKCVAATSTTACPTSGTSGTLYWKGAGSDPLSETDLAGNVQNTYVFFNGQRVARSDSAGAIHYYFSDHLGSHGVVENATGSTCEQDIDYYPYGGVENDYCHTVTQSYKFTGKERDTESGLDLMGARYFGSSLGRFMQPDPIYIARHRQADPQLLNLYQYGRNNPLRFTDVTGLDVNLDCSRVTSAQCKQTVADLNSRKGKEFDVTRNEKTGLLEAGVKDPSKLSSGESALYNAINDTSHHATLELVSQSDFVQFGRFDGNGHNTLDTSDLRLLGNVSQQAAGEVIAHEALEAFDSSFGNAPYSIAHGYANQFFGEATNPFVGRCDVCNPAWNLRDWSFGRIGETFQVKTIQTPVPDANRYAYEPGKIVEVKKAQEQ